MQRRLRAALCALLLCAGAAACAPGSTALPAAGPALGGAPKGGGPEAMLRVLHADDYLPFSFGDLWFQEVAGPDLRRVFPSLSFPLITGFIPVEAGSPYNLVFTSEGASWGTQQYVICQVPAMSPGGLYTAVMTRLFTYPTWSHFCALFQERPYTGAPQYRFHDAVMNRGAIAYGNGRGATVASDPIAFVVAATATPAPTSASPGPAYAPVAPAAVAVATHGAFGIADAAPAGSTQTSLAQVGYPQLIATGPWSLPYVDAVNAPGSAGTSVFAFNCNWSLSVPSVSCNQGMMVTAYTDNE